MNLIQMVQQHQLHKDLKGQKSLIEVVDSNFENRGELLLRHTFDGRELKLDMADLTLINLAKVWGRPVNIATAVDGKPILITCNGEEVKSKPLS